MPYVASVMVGWPRSNPTAGTGSHLAVEAKHSGWAHHGDRAGVPRGAPSIDQLGRRKGWLALAVALMIPLMFGLWWAKPWTAPACRSSSP